MAVSSRSQARKTKQEMLRYAQAERRAHRARLARNRRAKAKLTNDIEQTLVDPQATATKQVNDTVEQLHKIMATSKKSRLRLGFSTHKAIDDAVDAGPMWSVAAKKHSELQESFIPFSQHNPYIPPYYLPTQLPGPGENQKLDAIAVCQLFGLGFEVGSATKYLLRAGRKPRAPEIKDLYKAMEFIQRRINTLKESY